MLPPDIGREEAGRLQQHHESNTDEASENGEAKHNAHEITMSIATLSRRGTGFVDAARIGASMQGLVVELETANSQADERPA